MALSELTLEELEENFELFDDWEARYGYIIDLGKQLAPFEDAYRTDAYKVRGCISQVWMTSELTDDQPTRLVFHADSDAAIVRGLVAILLVIYSGKPPQEILETDIKPIFERLSLEQHISPNRRNGFFSMVERIKVDAARAAT